jgi:hypothetical protein
MPSMLSGLFHVVPEPVAAPAPAIRSRQIAYPADEEDHCTLLELDDDDVLHELKLLELALEKLTDVSSPLLLEDPLLIDSTDELLLLDDERAISTDDDELDSNSSMTVTSVHSGKYDSSPQCRIWAKLIVVVDACSTLADRYNTPHVSNAIAPSSLRSAGGSNDHQSSPFTDCSISITQPVMSPEKMSAWTRVVHQSAPAERSAPHSIGSAMRFPAVFRSRPIIY